MEQDTIKKRVQLSYRNKELKQIRLNMLEKKKRKEKWKYSSIAALFILFTSCTFYLSTITRESLISSSSYSLVTRSTASTSENNLIMASQALYNKNYNKAIQILAVERPSDHKDWMLLEANIGLGNFGEVENKIDQILADNEHLYYNRITFEFRTKVFLLSVM